MHIDAQLLLSDAQALTATAVGTNVIDTTNIRNLADGEELELVIQVDVAADFTSANETYQFDVETDDNASQSSAEVVARRIITAANLTAGSIHRIPIGKANERYLGVRYTLGGTTPTITVTSWIGKVSMSDKFRTYASGYTITG